MTEGLSLNWQFDQRDLARAVTARAAAEGLEDAGEFLLEQANRSVPLEESTLQRSGTVSSSGRNGSLRTTLKVAVAYDTPYAARQHEDTRLRHDAGRRAKWLQLSLAENRDQILNFLAERLREAM